MNLVSPPDDLEEGRMPLDQYEGGDRDLIDVWVHPEESMVEKIENDTAFVTPLVTNSLPYEVSAIPDSYAEFKDNTNKAVAFQDYKPEVTPLESAEEPDRESFHQSWSWTMMLFVTDGTPGNRSIQNPDEFENPSTFLIDTDGAGSNHLTVDSYSEVYKPDYNDIGQSLKVAERVLRTGDRAGLQQNNQGRQGNL